MKRLVVLGSTGSVGVNALNVVRQLRSVHPGKFKIVGLSAYSNRNLLLKQIQEFKPLAVCVGSENDVYWLKNHTDRKLKIFFGTEGLQSLAKLPNADIVLIAVVGAIGLYPLVSAIKSGKQIALANKESLVIAGNLINRLLKNFSSAPTPFIIPVDSEHSAIFQCLKNEPEKHINRIILTGSGGPFFQQKINFDKITPKEALKHPSWRMGKKITIDSATLMNKGFEIIEAHYLFDMPLDEITLLVHPESIVHSMVEFSDGAILALLSVPDMKLSIQYAITYPERYPSGIKFLQLDKIRNLTFFSPDYKKFPCIKLAIEAAKIGGTMTAVLNAANEVAVKLFLDGKLKFSDIPRIIEHVMNKHKIIKNPDFEDIIEADAMAREVAYRSSKHFCV
ncbi:MAG: 1-deoxy-D-xylulose-5-phosphate reductoisomerase [Elusimicrobiota bacterium]|nr:1-deoxy-D-xylulose-5-phosphate reductoisomerase [Elusimicrobiota bacterium]